MVKIIFKMARVWWIDLWIRLLLLEEKWLSANSIKIVVVIIKWIGLISQERWVICRGDLILLTIILINKSYNNRIY